MAKEDPKRQFFSIAHLITVEKLYEAFLSVRKDASAGIDCPEAPDLRFNLRAEIRPANR